ncbi:hypothetical protein BGW80DRAFT_28798 [Lactifluus volemus]|nr:hypothetical protein BGW80DRAFT_28798 [Lactifluus volemus]
MTSLVLRLFISVLEPRVELVSKAASTYSTSQPRRLAIIVYRMPPLGNKRTGRRGIKRAGLHSYKVPSMLIRYHRQ